MSRFIYVFLVLLVFCFSSCSKDDAKNEKVKDEKIVNGHVQRSEDVKGQNSPFCKYSGDVKDGKMSGYWIFNHDNSRIEGGYENGEIYAVAYKWENLPKTGRNGIWKEYANNKLIREEEYINGKHARTKVYAEKFYFTGIPKANSLNNNDLDSVYYFFNDGSAKPVYKKEVRKFLLGKSVEEILRLYGEPTSTASAGGLDTWIYDKSSAYCFSFDTDTQKWDEKIQIVFKNEIANSISY